MNLRYAFWNAVDKLKHRFRKPSKQELPPVVHTTVKAPEPTKIPMLGQMRSELSSTSGAARRRARKRKTVRKTNKQRNRQKYVA